jgi:predicted DNA-binding protein (UPF0251 family)/predicted Fe-Mo cluster-binding NifX family protein
LKGNVVARPRKCRRVNEAPDVTYFKPRGVPLRHLNEVHLSVEGYEALRLADYQGLKHADAAVLMHVSRQTFGRILSQARRHVAEAVINGWALRIQGGHYALNHQEKSTPIQEDIMDKIAITSEGPTLDNALDPRFGRAAGFIVVNPQTFEFEYVDNGASQAMAQGAGIQAAETIAQSGAKVLLTGYVGPKAFMALDAAGIKVAQNLENMTVRQAVERFNKGNIAWAAGPNRRGHGR